MDHFFDGHSSGDKCTLFSDKNLINRRNVGSDVSHRYEACKKFLDMEVDARIVAAACNLLGLTSVDDDASTDVLQHLTNIKNLEKALQKDYIMDLSAKIVDNLVMKKEKMKSWIDAVRNEDEFVKKNLR